MPKTAQLFRSGFPGAPAVLDAQIGDYLLAFHRAQFGDAQMKDEPPERPEGVSEAEWEALGDPGKAALVRERERATKAERDLAQERGKKDPPKPTPPSGGPKPPTPKEGSDGPTDFAALIQEAVQSALKPIEDRQAQWETQRAAEAIQDAVSRAAESRFHNPGDALAGVDLSTLTDGSGGPDATKISAALDKLLEAKPYLARPAPPRRAPDGTPMGTPPPNATPLDDRVKESLARMQQAAGVKFSSSS